VVQDLYVAVARSSSWVEIAIASANWLAGWSGDKGSANGKIAYDRPMSLVCSSTLSRRALIFLTMALSCSSCAEMISNSSLRSSASSPASPWSRDDDAGAALPGLDQSLVSQGVLMVILATPNRAARHDLRHIHATTLLLAGVPVHVVAARLGHADPSITLRVYAHVIKSNSWRRRTSSPSRSRRRRTVAVSKSVSKKAPCMIARGL
jgi:hypothetical protein